MKVWHDQLDHLWSSIMHRIIKNSFGHRPKNQKIFIHKFCATCAQGKLVTRLSLTKVSIKSSILL